LAEILHAHTNSNSVVITGRQSYREPKRKETEKVGTERERDREKCEKETYKTQRHI
jgi:hypothetical protein